MKNDLSIRDSSPTKYGGPQKFFEKKFLVLRALDPWANIHVKSKNFDFFLKKACKCGNRRWKNCVSIRSDSPTHYWDPEINFSEIPFGCSKVSDLLVNTHKIWEICVFSKKSHVNAKIGVKTHFIIRGGSTTHAEVLINFFQVLRGTRFIGYNT